MFPLWKLLGGNVLHPTYLLENFELNKGHLQQYTKYGATVEHLLLHRNSVHYQLWLEAVLLLN